ncbi:hypothetical protein Tco_0609406 [Tanacetum coccineum]
MLDSYTNSMCLESWRRSSFARILIEIDACNELSDHLVMAIPDLEGNGYTKETIGIEYEWEPPRCSTCLIFGHSPIDFPKAALKRVVNQKDKGTSNSPKTTLFIGMNKDSTSCYNKESPSNKVNTFSISNSYEALNDENPIIEEVATGSMTTT